MLPTTYTKTLKRRNFIISAFVIFIISFTIFAIISLHLSKKDVPVSTRNVLLIVVDDLRPALGCYGDKMAVTPNIDDLAARSILFANAHAQQALCAPSRTSFLTSRRPDSLHLYHVGQYWRHSVGNFTTLPQHFKTNGYTTYSIGKIFHPGKVSGGDDDASYSWSDTPFHPSTEKYENAKVCDKSMASLICPVIVEEQPEGTLPDIQIAQEAMRFLDNYSAAAPFFLAVGFHKPHVPLKFPREYLDLFPDMGLAPDPVKPRFLPDIAWNPWEDLRRRDDVNALNVNFPYGPLPTDYQKELRRAYYAATTYVDDLIGQVLETLERKDLAKNTIIALIGDHGWSLGEHQEWAKYSNLKVATNTPMIIRVPEMTEMLDHLREPFRHRDPFQLPQENNKNRQCASTDNCLLLLHQQVTYELVELVDLLPTLSQLTGLPVPERCTATPPQLLCMEGRSLYPLIDHYSVNGEDDPAPYWTNQSFSQYPRPSVTPQTNSDQPSLNDIKYMGYSAHLDHQHFVAWLPFDIATFKANWSAAVAHELYDLKVDPLEDNNIFNASDTETNSKFFTVLQKRFADSIVV